MKRLILIPTLAVTLLGSCDQIDAVGDKVNELKDMRQESTQGVDGMDLKALVSGLGNTGPTVQVIGEVDFQSFAYKPGSLNIVSFQTTDSKPCKELDPVLTEIVKANPLVRLGKLDVHEARELALEQAVSKVPDVRFYIDGKLVDQFTGAESKESIEKIIATHSASVDITAGIAARFTDDGPKPEGIDRSSIPPRPRSANAKPIEEAMKPHDKGWLPPGLSPKR